MYNYKGRFGMRVIAGTAKRLQLKPLEGLDTRPTTDRIKETLFNMLTPYVEGSVFLDLFAGSGGIGIEALSRGAKEAVFVEKNAKAMACVKENLQYTKLANKATTLTTDALSALHKLNGYKKFDYIFMDPPYNQELEKMALEYLAKADLMSEDCVIIIEASKETDFEYIDSLGFSVIKEKVYKTNKHIFLEKAGKEETC